MLCPRSRVLLSQSVRLWALHLLVPLEAPSCPVPTPELVSAAGAELSTHSGPKLRVSLSAGPKEQGQHPSLGSCPLGEPGAAPGCVPSPAFPSSLRVALCRQLRGRLPGSTWSCFFCVLSI